MNLYRSEHFRASSPPGLAPCGLGEHRRASSPAASLQAEEKRNGLPCGEASLITKKQDKYLLSLLFVI